VPARLIADVAAGLARGESIPYQPWAEALTKERAANLAKDDPTSNCIVGGVPRSDFVPYPFKVLEMPGMVVILYEAIHSYRQIFTDGRTHPAELDPTWFGHSIGHWEGKDTLVIDTVGFNDKFWFDRKGTPHSEKLHTTERWTRPNMGTLVNTVTIEDPTYYSKPFTVTFNARLQAPGDELMEYICQENNQYGQAGGHDNPFGK